MTVLLKYTATSPSGKLLTFASRVLTRPLTDDERAQAYREIQDTSMTPLARIEVLDDLLRTWGILEDKITFIESFDLWEDL